MPGANGRGRGSSGRAGGRPGAGKAPAANGSVSASNVGMGKAVRFTISSDFASGCQVQQQIVDAVEQNGYDEDSIFGVKLAVDEALINAIKHGNKLDPAKQVHIEASITRKQIEIIIEDEGPGFERAHVPDPTAEENVEKASGRGILLMEAYMDRVEWTNGGRRVRMVKAPAEKKNDE